MGGVGRMISSKSYTSAKSFWWCAERVHGNFSLSLFWLGSSRVKGVSRHAIVDCLLRRRECRSSSSSPLPISDAAKKEKDVPPIRTNSSPTPTDRNKTNLRLGLDPPPPLTVCLFLSLTCCTCVYASPVLVHVSFSSFVFLPDFFFGGLLFLYFLMKNKTTSKTETTQGKNNKHTHVLRGKEREKKENKNKERDSSQAAMHEESARQYTFGSDSRTEMMLVPWRHTTDDGYTVSTKTGLGPTPTRLPPPCEAN